MTLSFNDLAFKLICLLAGLVFFQKVLAVGGAGSFKTYELVALALLGFGVLHFAKNSVLLKKYLSYGPIFWLFLFFCVAPLLGLVPFYALDERHLYYFRFPAAADAFRFNQNIISFLIYVYHLMCFAVIFTICFSKRVYERKSMVVKIFVIVGSFVSLYSVYALIGINRLSLPDLVPDFLDQRNTRPDRLFRTFGFSSEPSNFVFLQTWILVLLLFFKPKMLKKFFLRLFLIFLNLFVLLMSVSTLIAPAAISLLVSTGIVGTKRQRLILAISCCMIFIVGSVILVHFDLWNLAYYIVVTKPLNFISEPQSTIDSGGFRAYTSALGFSTFWNYPLFGVGSGNSFYFLHLFEGDFHLKKIGETLDHTIPPQNSWAMIAAETGLFGLGTFLAFWISFGRRILKAARRSDRMMSSYVCALSFVPLALLSIYPIHSIYLWFNIALCLNELYFGSQPLEKRLEEEKV